MRLNHHGNFKVQRFQLFEQIKKDDCGPSPTVPHLPLYTLLVKKICIVHNVHQLLFRTRFLVLKKFSMPNGHMDANIIFPSVFLTKVGLPYVRFFPDMSGILVAKYASGRNVKQCFIVRDFGIMHFMKSNRNVFTVRII